MDSPGNQPTSVRCPLLSNELSTWETSNVRRKLSRVMWFPVEGEAEIPLSDRRVGSAIIWSPSPQQEMALRADWEELTEMVSVGRLAEITGRHGTHLQVRPKAANARSVRWGTDEQGAPLRTLPRGFYLRASFTASVLREHYAMSDLIQLQLVQTRPVLTRHETTLLRRGHGRYH